MIRHAAHSFYVPCAAQPSSKVIPPISQLANHASTITTFSTVGAVREQGCSL